MRAIVLLLTLFSFANAGQEDGLYCYGIGSGNGGINKCSKYEFYGDWWMLGPNAYLISKTSIQASGFFGDGFGMTNLNPANVGDGLGIAQVDESVIQQRVTGSCPGQVLVTIAQDGTVTCETDDTGTEANTYTSSKTFTNDLLVNGFVSLPSSAGVNAIQPVLSNSSFTISVYMTNRSSGTMGYGQIVIYSTHTTGINYSVAAATTQVAGVVITTSCARNANCLVAIAGLAQVQFSAAGVIGRHVQTSTTAGQATTSAAPAAGSTIGILLQNVAAGALGWVLLR